MDSYESSVDVRFLLYKKEVFFDAHGLINYLTQHYDGLKSIGTGEDEPPMRAMKLILDTLWTARENAEQGKSETIKKKWEL